MFLYFADSSLLSVCVAGMDNYNYSYYSLFLRVWLFLFLYINNYILNIYIAYKAYCKYPFFNCNYCNCNWTGWAIKRRNSHYPAMTALTSSAL